MFSRFMRTVSACATFTALSFGAAAAQTAPSPAPATTTDRSGGAPAAAVATPIPGFNPFNVKGLTISGTLRAYDFNRINTPEYNAKGVATGPNKAAFNLGGDIRADYKLGTTPFSIGGAFWGADPLGVNGGGVGCNVYAGTGLHSVIVHESAALCTENNGGIDNTLPGFALDTFEYYIKYNTKSAAITVGNQLLNKPWMPASDSRIKPPLYQGVDATFNVTKALAVGLTHTTRFDTRTESIFDQCTLLTCTSATAPAGVGAVKINAPPTTGADRVALTFKPNTRVSVLAETYRFHNIANLTYVESKVNPVPKNAYNPFAAFQFVAERQTGRAILGRIEAQTIGVQFGANPVKNVLVTVAADQTPWNYDDVAAASLTAAQKIATTYFLPSGGTNTPLATYAVNGGAFNGAPVTAIAARPGFYRIAYGGIASPYSDSYASDPLYTTSISQGMVERRSGGTAFKGAITYTSSNKRLVAIASEAAYNYDSAFAQSNAALRNRTYELDADVTYNFNAVGVGTYRGLSIRERFADRTQPTLPYNFKYLRHQLQFSF